MKVVPLLHEWLRFIQLPSLSLLRRISNPSQLSLGRYPTTLGSGRMSPRRRNKFLFAGFGWNSVTRLLSLQGKTEKKTGNFCTKQPLCAVFYGGFLLFEAVRPRNLAAGTRKSEPRKRKSRLRNFFFEPRNFFSRPRFFQTAAWNPFFPLFGTFSPTNPRCQYVGTSPARLTRPGNPGAETACTRGKKKVCSLICRHLGFRTFRETAFFAPVPAPCPVQANLRGLQMTKCQIHGQIAKCQIRRSVSAGKHETVPRYISTAPAGGSRNLVGI